MREREIRIIEISYCGLGFSVTPISVAQEDSSAVDVGGAKAHPGWLARIEDVRFSRSPSKQALAAGLRRIAAAEDVFDPPFYYSPLSWVFGSCLVYAGCLAELGELADRADRGDLGDVNDWRTAETRWKEKGLVEEDFLHISDDRWPFDRDIARVGFPVGSMHYFSTGRVRENTERIYDLLKRLSDSPRVQALLALSLAFALLRSDRLTAPESMSPDVVTSLLLNDRRTGLPMELALLFAQWSILDERWLNALDKIGTLKTFFYGLREREEAGVGALVHLFAKHSDRVGILPLIVAAFRMPSTPFELSGIPQVFFERYEDPKIRWAAVILELARGGVRRERAGTLATITAKLESDGVAELAEVLAALARYERFDEATDHYLLELQRHLSRAEWLQQGKLVAALNGSLRRRSSGVTEPGVWRSLALPDRLLDLVATSGVGAHPRSEAAP